jgi:hypothetical protein
LDTMVLFEGICRSDLTATQCIAIGHWSRKLSKQQARGNIEDRKRELAVKFTSGGRDMGAIFARPLPG